ncbi:hypothetical protein PIB30_048059 [Stylosanthes scabra]|uniref:Uncharacterized protein n=1 Tax=Stylosanthes scabra TaxID=79078 RepID=A0ABU6SHW8_9FABA|nr:hypothetical protein [Stylosanthes scabra]
MTNLLLGYEQFMYRLDQDDHIAARLQQEPSRVLRSRRLLLIPPDDRARGYFDMAGFDHVAYVVRFEHDWALASALLERW